MSGGRVVEFKVEPWGELPILGDAGPVLCCFFLDPRGAGDAA